MTICVIYTHSNSTAYKNEAKSKPAAKIKTNNMNEIMTNWSALTFTLFAVV